MLLYHRNKHDQIWPNPWLELGKEFPVIRNESDARLVTSAMLEYLAFKHDMVLEHFILNYQKLERSAGDVLPRSPTEIIADPDLRWSQDVCLDWSNPKEVAESKPVLSSRMPMDDYVVIVMSDGRSRLIDFKIGLVVDGDNIFEAFDGSSNYNSFEDVKLADPGYKGIWMK